MLTPGCTVGNIKIGKLLGRGAMGEVYSGEQITLKRAVAIKRIAGHLADDPEIIQRFAREAQCVAMINSPNVVAVFEFGQFIDDQNDKHYLIVMELVDGGYDLKSCIGTEINWQQASSVIMQVADGLTAAKEHDVIHRDIKPDNIMLSKKGVAKLADFGLAKNVDSTAMTMEGTLMGTPNYMPPEACKGEAIGAQGDVYSLGATWYHLITGMPLFTAANTMALLRAHCDEEPKPIQQVVPGIPDEVANLIMRCVAKDQNTRPSVAEIYKVLSGINDVPAKVPELVRIADAAKKAEKQDESTMATMKQPMATDDDATFMAGDGQAETIVTDQYQNQSGDVTAFATTGGNDDMTLMADTSASAAEDKGSAVESTQVAKTGSKAPLLIVAVLVIAAGIGAVVAMGGGDKTDPVDDPTPPANNTTTVAVNSNNGTDHQQTPTTNVEDPKKDPEPNNTEQKDPEPTPKTVDTAPMVKAVNEALAAKEYTKAKTAYDELAKHSTDHAALLTQIEDGQKNQQRVADELKKLHEQKYYATLGEKLTIAKEYPELKDLCATYQKACDDAAKVVITELAKTEALVGQQHWEAAASAISKVDTNQQVIGADAHTKRGTLQKKIDPALHQQKAVQSALTQLHVKEHYALLAIELPKAKDYPELNAQSTKLKTAVMDFNAKTKSSLDTAQTHIDKSEWSDAQALLKGVAAKEEIIGKEALGRLNTMQAKINAELKDQEKVAVSLKQIHDKGQFAVLDRALSKADPYPGLKPTVETYKKAIADKNKAVSADLKKAESAIAAQKWADASAALKAIGEDPLVVGKGPVVRAQKLQTTLNETASAAVTTAMNNAVAGVEAGTAEGLKKASTELRGALPAAKACGRENELKLMMVKLVEIIEKRGE